MEQNKGFTVMELLVVFAVSAILISISFNEVADSLGLVKANGDARGIASKLNSYRSMAVRLRSPVKISFTQQSGGTAALISADYGNDGSTDDTFSVSSDSQWLVSGSPGTPSDIVFTSLGIARTLSSGGLAFGVRHNGHDVDIGVTRMGLAKTGTIPACS